MMQAIWNGIVSPESEHAWTIEGNHSFPTGDADERVREDIEGHLAFAPTVDIRRV